MRIPLDPLTGKPLLSQQPQPAFGADPEAMLWSLKKQFSDPFCFFRECGAQNPRDAGAADVWLSLRQTAADAVTVSIRDNGSGMGEADIRRYRILFDSSKEGDPQSLGTYGVGRVGALALPGCNQVEVLSTRAEARSAYRLTFDEEGFCDGEQPVVLPADEARQELGTLSGTRLRVECRGIDVSDFLKRATAYIRRELRWVEDLNVWLTVEPLPEIAGTESVREELISIGEGARLPGSLAQTYRFKMTQTETTGQVDCDVTPDTASKYTPDPKCSHVTFTAGGLILEADTHFDWLNDGNRFSWYNMVCIIESRNFSFPLGRNRVYRDKHFNHLIPRTFKAIHLEKYLPFLLADLARPKNEALGFGYLRNCKQLLLDAIDMASERCYTLPDGVYAAPLFSVYGFWGRSVSYNAIRAQKKIYYTVQKPDATSLRFGGDEACNAGPLILDLYNTPWPARKILDRDFAGRLQEIRGDTLVLADETGSEALAAEGDHLRRLLPIRSARLRLLLSAAFQSPGLSRLEAAQLGKLDGSPDLETRAAVIGDPSTVHFNVNASAVRAMLEIGRRGGDRPYVAAFLLRELLLAKNLKLPERRRSELLTQACRLLDVAAEPKRATPFLSDRHAEEEELKALRRPSRRTRSAEDVAL